MKNCAVSIGYSFETKGTLLQVLAQQLYFWRDLNESLGSAWQHNKRYTCAKSDLYINNCKIYNERIKGALDYLTLSQGV